MFMARFKSYSKNAPLRCHTFEGEGVTIKGVCETVSLLYGMQQISDILCTRFPLFDSAIAHQRGGKMQQLFCCCCIARFLVYTLKTMKNVSLHTVAATAGAGGMVSTASNKTRRFHPSGIPFVFNLHRWSMEKRFPSKGYFQAWRLDFSSPFLFPMFSFPPPAPLPAAWQQHDRA